jgi:hypothetical protein
LGWSSLGPEPWYLGPLLTGSCWPISCATFGITGAKLPPLLWQQWAAVFFALPLLHNRQRDTLHDWILPHWRTLGVPLLCVQISRFAHSRATPSRPHYFAHRVPVHCLRATAPFLAHIRLLESKTTAIGPKTSCCCPGIALENQHHVRQTYSVCFSLSPSPRRTNTIAARYATILCKHALTAWNSVAIVSSDKVCLPLEPCCRVVAGPTTKETKD